MGINLTSQRAAEITKMMMKTQSALNRLRFLAGAVSGDAVVQATTWFADAEVRGIQIGKFDSLFSGVHTLETLLVMQQAHDAYVIGLLDAVPVLCRTALEEELTIRYLVTNGLVPTVAAGNPFKKLVDGKTRASLENLIQWARTTSPPILTATTLPLAKDIQEVGNDYAHAYAMRRVKKPMTGTGNLFTNTRALEIYEKTLKVFDQMP